MPDPATRQRAEIGSSGTRPGQAGYLPHRQEYVMECLGALEDFLHQEATRFRS